jgi:hypothetical protein
MSVCLGVYRGWNRYEVTGGFAVLFSKNVRRAGPLLRKLRDGGVAFADGKLGSTKAGAPM